MKRTSTTPLTAVLALALLATACGAQDTSPGAIQTTRPAAAATRLAIDDPWTRGILPREQISQYIRRMYQDRQGNIWFGTNGDGVCRYDGQTLVYYMTHHGMSGNTIRGIVQDVQGNMWFATDGGITRFDGTTFSRFTSKDGLPDNNVWSIMLDKAGTLWIGTDGGVCRYDGTRFTNFPLPVPDHKDAPGTPYPAPRQVSGIMQDTAGNIWFGTNGGGAYRYDGTSLTQYSKKEGLGDNFVQCIMQDKSGNMWFATRFGGVSRYDGKAFTTITSKQGLTHSFGWTLLEDHSGNIWLGTAGGGLFRYDGTSFTHYSRQQGLNNNHVQSILEDKFGRIWIGTSGGAYRLNGGMLTNFTKDMAGEC